MACNPANLSQFVVDLRSTHLSYWDQFTAPDPRVNNSEHFFQGWNDKRPIVLVWLKVNKRSPEWSQVKGVSRAVNMAPQ
eukprot:1139886-Pelagomonas_calceolata.AAC.4